MCQFFSFVTNGRGKMMYFDWDLRAKCLAGELDYEPDSHSSIADHFGFKGAREDNLNKYEYNPLTQTFRVDQINTRDDSASAEKWVKKLDFKKIVPQLNIHKIVHPFKGQKTRLRAADKMLLSQWDSVRDSVGGYTSSFFDLNKWKCIDHEEGTNPFQSCIDLWNRGFVASFDGRYWRLHHGKNAKVVYQATPKQLAALLPKKGNT